MSFKEAGVFMLVIKDVIPIAEPKFATGEYDFDVAIQVHRKDDPTQEGWWNGEMSESYGKGAVAHLTQKELTEQILRKLGWEGDDLTTLEALIGKETPGKIVEKDGYFNVQRLAVGGQARAVDPAKAAKILAMMGKGGAKAAPAAAPAKAKSDPFGAKAKAEEAEAELVPLNDEARNNLPF